MTFLGDQQHSALQETVSVLPLVTAKQTGRVLPHGQCDDQGVRGTLSSATSGHMFDSLVGNVLCWGVSTSRDQ